MRPGRKVLLCDMPLGGTVSFGSNRDVYGIASLCRCNVCATVFSCSSSSSGLPVWRAINW